MAEAWPYTRLCWEPVTVDETSAADIASARDASILLATHQSLPLSSLTPPSVADHIRLEDREVIGIVRESDILDAFVDATNDPLLMAVVGKSGSGKSHLVRWVHANLQDRTGFRVIYVPRQGTNLRNVLRRILEGLPGKESRDLLQALESATADMTVEHASAVLLDQLANTVQFRPPPHDDQVIDTMRRRLSGTMQDGQRIGGLPELLRLPEYRRHLLAPNGVISTYINHTLGEAEAPEEEYRRFEVEDLRLPLRRLNALDHHEIDVYEWISKNDEWAGVATALLNDALEEALTQVLGLTGRVSLAEVMTRSRELLHEQELELVLLIEDFALLENRIDRQLLEAILVPANSPGEPPRCQLRTMFAITDDPFERLQETVRTRLAALYRAGAAFRDTAGVDVDAAVDFVSSYLNAARVGPNRLIEEFARAGPDERQSGAWIPNACDTCPLDVQESCHSTEGFGANRGRYGLYPYNRPALERALATVLQGGWFDARRIVNRIVSDVLTKEAGSLETGRFPGQTFHNRFPTPEGFRNLPAEVATAAERHPDPKRRTILLTFWGAAPEVLGDVGSYIHEAFSLPPLGKPLERPADEKEPEAERPVEPLPPRVPPSVPVPPPAADPDLDAIDRWLAQEGTALPDDLIQRLRPRLHELVIARINWNDELLSPSLAATTDSGEVFSPLSFDIRPGLGRAPKPTAVRFVLEPRPENAVLLKAVVRLTRQGAWAGQNAADDFLLLQRRVDDWAAEVLAAVRTFGVGVEPWTPVPAALECLILAAGVAGVPGALDRDPGTIIAAALHPTVPGDPPDRVHDTWKSLHAAATSPAREEVRRLLTTWVQAAQGEGAALAIDLPRLVGVASRFRDTLKVSAVPAHGPQVLRAWRSELAGKLQLALIEQGRELAELAERLRPYHRLNLPNLASLLLEAGQTASDRGVFVEGDQFGGFMDRCRKLEGINLAALEPFADASVAAASDPATRFRAVTTLIPLLPEARQLMAIMSRSVDHLEKSIARAKSDLRNAPDLPAAQRNLDGVLAGLQASAGGAE